VYASDEQFTKEEKRFSSNRVGDKINLIRIDLVHCCRVIEQ